MDAPSRLVWYVVGVCFLAVYGVGFKIDSPPKALKVDCKSQGNSTEFQHRVFPRGGAEDKITILLCKNEELSILFHMPEHSILEVLDVRYSNDGGEDIVQLSIDGDNIGQFKTKIRFNWGYEWNRFVSSGPIGGPIYIGSGEHRLTLTIADSDKYGMEIDYIRFNVHGSKIDHLDDEFVCLHKPFADRGDADNDSNTVCV